MAVGKCFIDSQTQNRYFTFRSLVESSLKFKKTDYAKLVNQIVTALDIFSNSGL